MLKKCLLVMGALVIGLVEGMDRSLLTDRASGGMRMDGSDFFYEYNNLQIGIERQIGFSRLEGQDRFRSLRERMISIGRELLAVCDGEIANYSEDRDSEVRRLAAQKSYHLVETVSEFFGDLRNALQTRKDSMSWWVKLLFPRVRELQEQLSNYLRVLDRLDDFLGRDGLRNLLIDCFRTAYDRGELRGNEELQHWYALYNDYRNGRGSLLHCFSPFLMNEFNERTMELASRGYFNALNGDPSAIRAISEWEEEFFAIRSFRLPTESLNRCLADDEILMADLRNGGIGEGYRREITRTWKDSVEGLGGRCTFFIPSLPIYDIERFFRHSGGTTFSVSVADLLERNLESLNETLWGAPIRSRATPKGLVLSALLAQTNEIEARSYLNAMLIICDLERLCEAQEDRREHVARIWNFIIFVTGRSLDVNEDNEFYRFPYLGIDGRDQGGRIDLHRLNVVLSTPRLNLGEIIEGITPVVGPAAAHDVERRMNLVVDINRDIDE